MLIKHLVHEESTLVTDVFDWERVLWKKSFSLRISLDAEGKRNISTLKQSEGRI